MQLNEGERVRWPGGQHTPPIADRGVYPRPWQDKLPIWIAVGGTPQSVARAGVLGLPLALAIIGGEPARFAPLFDLYRQAAQRAERDVHLVADAVHVDDAGAVESLVEDDAREPADHGCNVSPS